MLVAVLFASVKSLAPDFRQFERRYESELAFNPQFKRALEVARQSPDKYVLETLRWIYISNTGQVHFYSEPMAKLLLRYLFDFKYAVQMQRYLRLRKEKTGRWPTAAEADADYEFVHTIH